MNRYFSSLKCGYNFSVKLISSGNTAEDDHNHSAENVDSRGRQKARKLSTGIDGEVYTS